jgi:uncharacterized membrane protein
MNWYSLALKRTLKGAVLFLLPVMIMLILLKKAAELIRRIIEPLQSFLPADRVFGVGILSLLTLLIILFICFLAGWRADKKGLKSFLPFVEEHILSLIPGYTLLKSSADEATGDDADVWKAVLVGEEGDWKFGIEVEHHEDGYSAVFFPEPPDAKAGEIKLIHTSKLKHINIPASKLISITRKYGHGSGPLTAQLKI